VTEPERAPDDLAVGDVVELLVGPVAHGGHCVARFDGRVVFVRYGLPGERVRARITEAKPGSFCRAEAVEVLDPHPARVPPPCDHFHPGGCGGCDFQHAGDGLQRELKAAVVSEQLRRLAGVDLRVAVIPLPGDGFGWRTRVRWALDDDGRIGPRRFRSHLVEAVGPAAPCLIAAPGLSEMAAVVDVPQGVRPRGTAQRRAGRRAHGEVRRDGRPGPAGPEVTLVSPEAAPDTGENRAVLAIWPGEPVPTVLESAAGRSFEVMADGFWQVHPAAADTLAAAVDAAVADRLPTGGTGWDLYGGVGLFAAVLATRVGTTGRVLSVEQDRAASALAAANLADLPQVLTIADRVDAMLSRPADVLPEAHRQVDAVVLDPPRSGAGAELCRRIAAREPAVIVYVACDPAALGRDTAALLAAGYRLDTLQAFDCYPQTHHVECVARFLPA
jgi:tRNA/tmRNA/rRNA uracil-C5-methylase (TrmA/RlmC/RlmD family)